MKEKKEFTLKGEAMPICIGREHRSQVITEYVVRNYIIPQHQYIPSEAKYVKVKKPKLKV